MKTEREALLAAVRPWEPWSLRTLRWVGVALLVGTVYFAAARQTEMDLAAAAKGWPFIVDFLSRMFPPDPVRAPRLIRPLLETFGIALWGTTLAVLLALPLGLLAAANITPFRAAYLFARGICNLARAIPAIIFALFLVVSVGLGPFPGVMSVMLNSMGMLGKFFADAIEEARPGPIEAAAAAGAGQLLTVRYAILPQMFPPFLAYAIYRFEVNVRAATVLGLVGAGGLGFELLYAMRLFDYESASFILLLMFAIVWALDYGGSMLRKRIV